jgi:hypothetical protein
MGLEYQTEQLIKKIGQGYSENFAQITGTVMVFLKKREELKKKKRLCDR